MAQYADINAWLLQACIFGMIGAMVLAIILIFVLIFGILTDNNNIYF